MHRLCETLRCMEFPVCLPGDFCHPWRRPPAMYLAFGQLRSQITRGQHCVTEVQPDALHVPHRRRSPAAAAPPQHGPLQGLARCVRYRGVSRWHPLNAGCLPRSYSGDPGVQWRILQGWQRGTRGVGRPKVGGALAGERAQLMKLMTECVTHAHHRLQSELCMVWCFPVGRSGWIMREFCDNHALYGVHRVFVRFCFLWFAGTSTSSRTSSKRRWTSPTPRAPSSCPLLPR
jgi:hypothetical protein